jgi:uncharacterized coiled-coil DUF342 family protein
MATRTIKTKLSLDGEKQWKNEMASVNSQLKTLKSDLAASSSEFKGQANSIGALTAKQKILREQYDQQKEKVRALKDALAEAEKVYADSPEKIDKYKQQLNYATVQLNNMDEALQENAKYIEEAQQSADGHAKSIDEFGKEVKDAGEQTDTFGSLLKANLTSEAILAGLKALVNGIKAVGAGLKDAVVDAAAYADEVMTDSVVTGLSTDALQEYRYMAELTDTSVDTITGSLAKLTKNMSSAKDGSGGAADAFAALGVSVTDTHGELRNNQEVFEEVIDALGQMDNETQRDAYSMAIFGKSAQDLNPLMAQGAEGLAAFRQEAHDMGYVLSEDALQALGAVDDSMQRFHNALDAAKNKVSIEFAPGISSVFDGLTAIISGDVDGGVAMVESGVDQLGTALEKMGPYAQTALELLINTIIDSLPSIIDAGAQLLSSLITGIANAMPQLVPATVNLVMEIVQTLINHIDVLISAAIRLTIGIATGLIRAIPQLVSKIPQIISAIVRGLISGVGQLSEVGSQLIRGLWNGISNMGAWIGQKIRGFGQHVLTSLKNFFGIHSPSTVMEDEVGQYLGQGVTVGFVNSIDEEAMRKAIPTSFDISADVTGGINAWSNAQNRGYYNSLASMDNAMDNLRQLVLAARSGQLVVNVYGAAGQSVDDLANAVMRKIQIEYERRYGGLG